MECAGFTDYLNGRGLDQRTVAYYVGHCRKAEAWLLLHGANLDNCRATVLAEWSRTLPNSHSTRGQVAAALRHYWLWVERPNPPAGAIRVPPQPEMVCRTLESDETRNLVKVALGWWPQGTAVLIGLYLALRRFEIAKAEWSRFDDEFAWYTVTGKRSKTATLPVHPILKSELVARGGAGWLFPGRLAGHVNPATIGGWIGEVAEASGVIDLTPHRLRHTSLTWANDRMGDLRAVQAFARHSNPQVTAGYTRTKVTTLQAVSRSLDYLESNDVRPGNSGNSCPCGSGGDAE